MNCPECGGKLMGRAAVYTCQGCYKEWKVDFQCAACGSEPEIVQSCGAVTFFCTTCKAIQSRESMKKFFSAKK